MHTMFRNMDEYRHTDVVKLLLANGRTDPMEQLVRAHRGGEAVAE